MTTWRLFPSTAGPAGVAAAYAGNFQAGVTFKVTQWGLWFTGYWRWIPANGDAGAERFALWQATGAAAGSLVPGSLVTSGALTLGAWNFVPLAAPLALPGNISYIAASAYVAVNGFPETKPYFGTGGTAAAGITNGPLTAFSDQAAGGGTNAEPGGFPQGSFGTATADPSTAVPGSGSDTGGNFWMDVQITDQPPGGVLSYRLWPNMPALPPVGLNPDSALNFTLATEFALSQACTLNRIWWFSPSGTTQLPTEVGIYRISDQQLVTGTHVNAPAWSGAAGSGWVSCSFAGVTLPADRYKVAACNGAASPPAGWNDSTLHYFDTGPGAAGITNGPLSAPNVANAAAPGQGTFHQGTALVWADTSGTGQTYWVDVEVTPVPVTAPQSSIVPAWMVM